MHFLPASFEATDVSSSVRSLGYWARRGEASVQLLPAGGDWERGWRGARYPGQGVGRTGPPGTQLRAEAAWKRPLTPSLLASGSERVFLLPAPDSGLGGGPRACGKLCSSRHRQALELQPDLPGESLRLCGPTDPGPDPSTASDMQGHWLSPFLPLGFTSPSAEWGCSSAPPSVPCGRHAPR